LYNADEHDEASIENDGKADPDNHHVVRIAPTSATSAMTAPVGMIENTSGADRVATGRRVAVRPYD
jgi:hypothetical protein